MYPYWTDNWETPKREEKEDEQNRRITESLAGRRCPGERDVIEKLKGEQALEKGLRGGKQWIRN